MSEAEKMTERLDNELGWGIGPAMLCQEAAALIRRLAAENECFMELLQIRSESGMAKDMQEIMKANNELAAENAALKAELKQEQEDQSEMLLIAHLDGLTKNREAHAKELAAQAERIAKLEEAAAEDIAMLRELSSALGAGAGDDTTTADQLRKRILSSAEIHYGAGRVRGRADASVIVEELSKTPNTTWGEIVRAIRSTEPRNE